MGSNRKPWTLRLAGGAAVVVAVAASTAGCGRAGSPDETGTEVTVHVDRIVRTTLHRSVEAYGRIEPEPAGGGRPPARAIVGAPVGGLLTEILCAEGQRVSCGAPLFELDSRTAEVEVATAQTALDYAERFLARQRELLEAGGASEQTVQEAEQRRDAAANELAAARTRFELLHVAAPVAGTIIRVQAVLGQPVEASTVLAEIIDLDRLMVETRVPSAEAPSLELGQRVELAEDGSELGQVVFVGRDIDPATDTVIVRASLPAGSALRPGQAVEVRIIIAEHRECLAVPEASVVSRSGEGSWVVLVRGDTAVRQPVGVGLREKGLVEVLGPALEEGATVVTDDAYALPAATKVRILGS
jgi:membrane fusion protein (multidrug efflux system)